MKIYKAPDKIKETPGIKIFLGGSIEQGKAINWQDKIAKLCELEKVNVTIFNPRRDDWDSTWVQDPTPGTQFHEQVTWELNRQDESDIIIYYFDAKTKSPITLLELGLYATQKDKTVIVFCPEEFYRYGNVKIVCDKYNISCFTNEAKFLKFIIDKFKE